MFFSGNALVEGVVLFRGSGDLLLQLLLVALVGFSVPFRWIGSSITGCNHERYAGEHAEFDACAQDVVPKNSHSGRWCLVQIFRKDTKNFWIVQILFAYIKKKQYFCTEF